MLGIEPGSYCLAARKFTTLPNVPYGGICTFNRNLSYVNSTAGRNFNFKADLTLIQATPQPFITSESVRLHE